MLIDSSLLDIFNSIVEYLLTFFDIFVHYVWNIWDLINCPQGGCTL